MTDGLVYAVVNLQKDWGHRRTLIRYATAKGNQLAKKHNAEGVVLMLTEFGHGSKSVRVRPVGAMKKKAGKQRFVRITPFGAHNHMAVRPIRSTTLGLVRNGTVHGLHKGTQGKARQDRYFNQLRARVCRWTANDVTWVVAGDFNRGFRQVRKLLGGIGRGKGIDAVIVGPGLRNKLLDVDRSPIKRRHTDHPIIFTLVRRKR